MSGDVRDGAEFTFQAGRGIQEGWFRMMFVLALQSPEAKVNIHPWMLNDFCGGITLSIR